MAEVKWIKMATDIFDNRKIRQIESLPDGDAIIVIWVKLLCLAGNINDAGMVYFTKEIPYTDQMLATQFSRPLTTIQLALKVFEQFGMVEVIDSILHISNWEKYQSVDRLQEIREYNRLAKQKSREKQKLLLYVNDESMTSQRCQDTDIDKDKEEDKKEIKREKKNTPAVYYPTDDLLNQTFTDYVEMRKKLKSPMTERAIQLAMGNLEKLSGGDNDIAVQILEQSIMNSWKGLFALKEEKRSNTGGIDWSKV